MCALLSKVNFISQHERIIGNTSYISNVAISTEMDFLALQWSAHNILGPNLNSDHYNIKYTLYPVEPDNSSDDGKVLLNDSPPCNDVSLGI